MYWDFYQKCERYTDTIKETERIQEAILQLEESKKRYSENSIMRSRIQEQIQKLIEQTSIVSDVEDTFRKTKQELLELTATSFEIDQKNEQTLSGEYIRALS